MVAEESAYIGLMPGAAGGATVKTYATIAALRSALASAAIVDEELWQIEGTSLFGTVTASALDPDPLFTGDWIDLAVVGKDDTYGWKGIAGTITDSSGRPLIAHASVVQIMAPTFARPKAIHGRYTSDPSGLGTNSMIEIGYVQTPDAPADIKGTYAGVQYTGGSIGGRWPADPASAGTNIGASSGLSTPAGADWETGLNVTSGYANYPSIGVYGGRQSLPYQWKGSGGAVSGLTGWIAGHAGVIQSRFWRPSAGPTNVAWTHVRATRENV